MRQEKIKKIEVDKSGIRIDNYLTEKLENISRSKIKKLIIEQKILVNQKTIKPSFILSQGENIVCDLEVINDDIIIKPQKLKLDIIYEDDYYIAINKPAGMVVHPGNGNRDLTLVNGLLYYLNNSNFSDNIRPGIVHRLDKDTSGIIITAKSDEAHESLAELFQNRKVSKVYKAIVWGCPEDKGNIKNFIKRDSRNKTAFKVSEIDGKEAITDYKLLKNYGPLSEINLFPYTGRTHQLRVHMRHIGHPIFGDDKYSGGIQAIKSFHTKYSQLLRRTFRLVDRQMLHAYSIEFIHPFSNKKVYFSAEIPSDMKKIIKLWLDEV